MRGDADPLGDQGLKLVEVEGGGDADGADIDVAIAVKEYKGEGGGWREFRHFDGLLTDSGRFPAADLRRTGASGDLIRICKAYEEREG